MDSNSAWKIIESGEYGKGDLSEQEKEFLFREAQEFLVRESPEDLDITSYNLASRYLAEEEFDLALKYFEVGAALDSSLPLEQAGRIHYFGLAHNTSMERAYCYLKRADEKKWFNGSYLLADMYYYGQCVDRDESKYEEMIERLSEHYAGNENWRNATAEVMLRLAEIWQKRGEKEAGYALLSEAESFIKQRISLHDRKRTPHADIETLLRIQNNWFGREPENLEIVDLLDVFFVIQHELTDNIAFIYDDKEYIVNLVKEEEGFISVKFEDTWYRSPRGFIDKAMLGSKRLRSLVFEETFEIV